jgi:hypothetical protein
MDANPLKGSLLAFSSASTLSGASTLSSLGASTLSSTGAAALSSLGAAAVSGTGASALPGTGAVISPEVMTATMNQGIVRPVYYTVGAQDPPAGSLVPRGSTVTLTLVNLHDISFSTIPVETPQSLDNVSLAAAAQMLDSTPELKEAVNNPEVTLSAEDAADLINKSSAGVLTEALTVDALEAPQVLEAFRLITPRF